MPLNEKKFLSMLGLAARAGKVASGEFSTEKAVKERKAKLVIVAEDASDNTKKNFKDMCNYYKVPILICTEKEVLGHSIGKMFRASIALTDEGFAKAVLKIADQNN